MEEQHNTRRGNQTRTISERYSRDRMENIKQIVSRFERNGKSKLYSISIDSELVIPKTDDPTQFDEYLDYLHPTTECIEVRTYYGTSPNCNVYRYYLREVPQPPSQALHGIAQMGAIDVEEKIQQALDKQRLESDIKDLKKDLHLKEVENEALKKRLKNFKKLKAKLDEKKIDINDLFTKGVELIGVFQGKKTVAATPVEGPPPAPPAEVVIEPQNSALDKHIDELKKNYPEEELLKALHAGELFARYPELKDDFQRIINQKISKNG